MKSLVICLLFLAVEGIIVTQETGSAKKGKIDHGNGGISYSSMNQLSSGGLHGGEISSEGYGQEGLDSAESYSHEVVSYATEYGSQGGFGLEGFVGGGVGGGAGLGGGISEQLCVIFLTVEAVMTINGFQPDNATERGTDGYGSSNPGQGYNMHDRQGLSYSSIIHRSGGIGYGGLINSGAPAYGGVSGGAEYGNQVHIGRGGFGEGGGFGIDTRFIGNTGGQEEVNSISQPGPATIPQPLPTPVNRYFSVPVFTPYTTTLFRPLHLSIPQTFPITILRPVPVTVNRHVPMPISQPISFPVSQPYTLLVPQPVAVPLPQPVAAPVPQPLAAQPVNKGIIEAVVVPASNVGAGVAGNNRTGDSEGSGFGMKVTVTGENKGSSHNSIFATDIKRRTDYLSQKL